MGFVNSKELLDQDERFDSTPQLTDRSDSVAGSVFSDQDGTLFIEQSSDQIHWDISTFYSVTAGDGKGFSESLLLPYWRIGFLNGNTEQTEFRIYAKTWSAGRQS